MVQVESSTRTYEVAALKRGLSILDCFMSSSEESLTVSQIARAVGIHRATVFRFLSTLESTGYIEGAGRAGGYRLGRKLQSVHCDPLWLPAAHLIAVPVLKDLADSTEETSDMGVLYRGDVVFVHVVEGPQSVRVRQRVGDRHPAHLTAMGKVLLAGLSEAELAEWLDSHPLTVMTPNSVDTPQRLRAELAEIRRCGYAVDWQEYELGLTCVAAPVQDASGRVVAGIAVSGPSSRVTYHRIPEIAEAVQQAARQVAAVLGGGA